MPPVPEANALIVVPAVTFVPEMALPTYNAPLDADVMVRIVPEIEPMPEKLPAMVIGPVDMAFLLDVMLYAMVTVCSFS